MAEHKHTVNETLNVFKTHAIGWFYKDKQTKEYFYNGESFRVEKSNISIPDSEVRGEITGNKFISNDKQYEAYIEKSIEDRKAVAIKCLDGVVIVLKNSLYFPFGRRIEGYWASPYQPHFPMPVPNILTEVEAQEIFELIKTKEKKCEIHSYRGCSESRIDGTFVDNKEYHSEEWLWPAGFAEHYVLKYKVKPTDDFLKYLGWLK